MGKRITDIKKALLERATISPTTNCWEWNRSLGSSGYASVEWNGQPKKLVHRLSYETFVGPIPEGLCACHKCDNPKCFNPEHLFLGTKRDNRLDQIAKGRSHNSGLTHCKRGHEFTADNTSFGKKGRTCRTCHKVKGAASYLRRKSLRAKILPGDDSVRDLALAKIRLKRAEDAAYHALLHMSAWLGIPDKKREQFIEDEMGNVRFCCQNNLPQDLERIERENRPKQDEGK